MATIASQVVLHPVVSQSLKVGGTTLGRDKVITSSLFHQLYEETECSISFYNPE